MAYNQCNYAINMLIFLPWNDFSFIYFGRSPLISASLLCYLANGRVPRVYHSLRGQDYLMAKSG